MIATTTVLVYRRDNYNRSGGWRYSSSGPVVIICDHDGCDRHTTAAGLEHNGPTVECIYLRDEDRNRWEVGDRDLCPEHAPVYEECEVCDGTGEGEAEWGMWPPDCKKCGGSGRIMVKEAAS